MKFFINFFILSSLSFCVESKINNSNNHSDDHFINADLSDQGIANLLEQQLLEQEFQEMLRQADAGDASAQYEIALVYDHGTPTIPQDVQIAFSYYLQAANQNHEESLLSVAYCYEYGRGTEKNVEKVFEYYKKAADLNNECAIYRLARCYEEAIGTEKNVEKAFEYYKKSADLNYIEGIYKTGLFYKNGISVEQDYQKACQYFLQGVQKNHYSNSY